jgi:ribulose-5-phosphate 4-epimerase/fuculose-1-phosphate aldolase
MDAATPLSSTEPAAIPREEWSARVALAAASRFAALEGWDDLCMAHMSARIPGTTDRFLFIPTELAFDEITASSLQEIDGDGQLLSKSPYPTHKFAYALHMPTYRRFPQAACIIHLHSKAGTAVSMQKRGLLPSSQYALWLGPVGYVEYHGHVADLAEGERLALAFGYGKVLMMRCHGTMVWGETIPQAFILNWTLTRACENQVLAQAGQNDLYQPSDDVIAKTPDQARSITAVNAPFAMQNWHAVLRRLDRIAPDYKT